MASQFRTFTAGEVFTAANVNNYLMKQSVIVCDSSADYPTPNEGMVVYDKALDAFLSYTGSAWVRILPLTSTAAETWAPVVTQSGSVAATVTEATYVRTGAVVDAWAYLSITGSGTSAQPVTVSLPVTAAATLVANTVVGSGFILDTSAADQFPCAVALNSTTTVNFLIYNTAGQGRFGVDPSTALASGDEVRFHVRYVV